MNLPIPYFNSVKKIINLPSKDLRCHGEIILIAKDPMAGLSNVYSVVKINLQDGKSICVGRELNYSLALKMANKYKNF